MEAGMTVVDSWVGSPAPSGTKPAVLCDDDAARLWKDVFAQGRVVEAGDERATGGDPPRDPRRADEAAPGRGPARSAAGTSVREPVLPGPDGPVLAGVRSAASPSAMPAAASIDPVPASVRPSGGGVDAVATTSGMAVAPRAAVRPGLTVLGESPVAVLDPIADDLPVPEEVVQVHEADGALTFVIRDRSLADAAAVRCALETARRLTGDARAVRQVTLNGRTIYTDASPAPRPRGTGASFTC
jgi:hypothetical protein